MRKSLVKAGIVIAALALLAACDKELKPSKLGIFVVADNKLADWPPTMMDEEATPEGFFLPFFRGEVTTLVRYPTTYAILYGDYRPLGIREFVRRNGRLEEAGGGEITDAIQAQQFKGEKQMYKVKLTRELKPGIYVLDIKQTEGRQLHFAFKIP